MNTVAFYWGSMIIYWSSVVIALGTVCCIALTLALYTARGGKAGSVFALTPIAICFSLILARFIHWYCHTEQYKSLVSAMTSFSSGNYCMPGVLIGVLLAVLLLKGVGTVKKVTLLLDCLVPGFTVLTVFIRLSAFFNSTCRSKFTVKNPVFQRFPIAVPATDSSGVTEWRFSTFFAEAIILALITVFLLWFYFNRRGVPMKNGLPKRGNTALMFLLLFSAAELVSDSTRYDASFARFNGFISVTQMFSAVSAAFVLVAFSVRSLRANGFKSKHVLLWILFLVSLAATGFCEYLVQRHGDWYVAMYAAMSAAVILMVVSVWMMYKTLPEVSTENKQGRKNLSGRKKVGIFIAAAAVILCTVSGVILSMRFGTHTVTGVLTEEELAKYRNYPALEYMDLSGSTCYAAIEDFKEKRPETVIRYTIDTGGVQADSETQSLDLSSGNYRLETLLKNSVWLKEVKKIELGHTDLDSAELDRLRGAFPEADLNYTFTAGGMSFSSGDTKADLAKLAREDIGAAEEVILKLPVIEYVELAGDKSVSGIGADELKQLYNTNPDAEYHYTFSFYGQNISTTDKEIKYKDVAIGDEGFRELKRYLPFMKNCTYLLLDNCGIDYELLSELRDEYRDRMKVVWRIEINQYVNRLSDIDVFWSEGKIQSDEELDNFKYFEELKYIDLGHCPITDVTFLKHTPKVQVLIIAHTFVKDITPVGTLKDLWYLELFANYVDDISPLAACMKLEHINCANLLIDDISCLYDKTHLVRAHFGLDNLIPRSQIKEITERLPNCIFLFNNASVWHGNWRNNDYDGTWDMTYLYIRDIFGYNRDLGCEHLGRDYAADVVKPDMTDFYEQELQFYHDNPGIFIAKDFGAAG